MMHRTLQDGYFCCRQEKKILKNLTIAFHSGLVGPSWGKVLWGHIWHKKRKDLKKKRQPNKRKCMHMSVCAGVCACSWEVKCVHKRSHQYLFVFVCVLGGGVIYTPPTVLFLVLSPHITTSQEESPYNGYYRCSPVGLWKVDLTLPLGSLLYPQLTVWYVVNVYYNSASKYNVGIMANYFLAFYLNEM